MIPLVAQQVHENRKYDSLSMFLVNVKKTSVLPLVHCPKPYTVPSCAFPFLLHLQTIAATERSIQSAVWYLCIQALDAWI